MTENTITLADNDTTRDVVNLVRQTMSVENRQGRYLAFIQENGVTPENLNDYAKAIAALIAPVGPQKDKAGKRTRYGNALNTAKTGLSRNMPKDETDPNETDWLRLVRQAAENAANKGGFDVETIVQAAVAALTEQSENAA